MTKILEVDVPSGLFDELWALEVDTADEGSPAAKLDFVAAMRSAQRVGRKLRLRLLPRAAWYMLNYRAGALENGIDLWRDYVAEEFNDPSFKARARAHIRAAKSLIQTYGPLVRYDKLENPPRATNRGPWWHGDVAERETFSDQRWDRDPHTSSLNVQGPGVYFTNARSEAETYGSRLYEMHLHPTFRLMPRRRPTLAFLRTFWDMANDYDRVLFLTNWGLEETDPPDAALRKYLGQNTMHDAAVSLYGDLIRSPEEWVAAVRATGYDGVIVDRSSGGHRGRKHLVVWSPDKTTIREAR